MADFQFTQDWFTAHIPNWEKWLSSYNNAPNVTALEIGAFEGRASCWLLQNILTDPTSKLICVDTFQGQPYYGPLGIDTGGSERRFRHNVAQTGVAHKVQLLKGNSYRALKLLGEASVDFAYVDGEHTSPGVLEDLVLTWRALKPGGLIIIDDYLWCRFPEQPTKNPRLGIDAFCSCYLLSLDVLYRDTQVVVKKKT